MKNWFIFCFIFLGLTLSGCVEIIDDLTINLDGSGTFKYSINLSSSKVKVNSILALDSLDGKPIPSKDEIKQKVSDFKLKLEQKEGISNVFIDEDYTNYIFKINCDFSSLEMLQSGIKKTINEMSKSSKSELDDFQWATLKNDVLTRSIPETIIEQAKKIKAEDLELLKQGTYTSITRFEKEVLKFDNENALLAKNKKAVMLRINAHDLLGSSSLIENKISLVHTN